MRRRLWALFWLVSVMTGGGRCHRRKKMMGRGADGGCGTEERPCPVHKVPAKIPTTNQKEVIEKPALADIDFYSQAKKALCERSPFDVAEGASSLTVPTLPSGLASFLSRQSDSRKRHKKSHSSTDKKKSSRVSEKSRVSNIWVETEVYFRDLTLPDIDALSEIYSFGNSTTRKCFLIPCLGTVPRANAGGGSGENVNGGNANGVIVKDENANRGTANEVATTENKNVNGGNANEGVVKNENVDGGDGNGVVIEEVKPENEQSMEIDGVEDDSLLQRETNSSVSDLPTGLEWLLGCRNKLSLTSERPSKKRKLLGVDAGLEKVLVACSCAGNSSLCHFCSTGDTGKELNRLIFCSSCQVAVHQKCYGVQEPVDSSWLCTWCKQKTDSWDSVKPCVLCPKQGGALKPVFKNVGSDGPVEFAHLFCCQWMPEVYIMDLLKMEPIMNVEGIKETRRKLVCNICKVKWGACVRCSHGTCRTSFHPLCARDARHRMEVWGKYGCDNVELRAFCSKHSDILDNGNTSQLDDPSVAVGSNFHATNHLPAAVATNKLLKVDQKNGDNIAIHSGTPDTSSDQSNDSEPQEIGLADSRLMSECNDAQPLNDVEIFEGHNVDVDASDSINFKLILKKLVDRGRVNVKDVASDIGVAPDSLSASLAEDTMVPDVLSKIVKWLKNHAYLNSLQKNLRVKIRSSISSKAEFGANDDSDNEPVSESDVAEPVAVKSVPPRRRTKSNVRILKDTKTLCSTDEISSDNGKVMDKAKVDQVHNEEADDSSKLSLSDVVEKNLTQPDAFQHSSPTISPKSQVSPAEPLDCSIQQSGQAEEDAISAQNTCVNADGKPSCSIINSVVPDFKKTEAEAVSSFYIHPDVQKKLLQMQNGVTLKDPVYDFNGDDEISRFEASANASVCCDHQNKHARCNEVICNQLVKARKMGILEVSPEDEVEGELIYFQHRLLENAVARKHFTDNLTCNVAKSLPEEIDQARTRRWDAVLVNQYLCELREAKKQGRKERRHKEAQAVLAAATAAAAASSRISSFRKDAFDETSHPENMMKLNTSSGRSGSCSQLIPRAKETLQRVAIPRISFEKHSDLAQSVADISKEHPRSCDICRRSETILNPILVCSGCKVAVHLDCYRSVKESTGPWYCEVCEEASSSRNSGAPAVNFWEQSFFLAECGLCGGTTGAFRKSSSGQWVHAFCAEWLFETTFRRGQANPVEGMETVSKGVELCYICRRKSGVCIKCNYGHCQATFHPSCARSAGYYMNVKIASGKQQHKAYCEKHSVEQRAKAETHKHGIEELKSLKQIRVELEKLRLLCERIIKREKLKRELVVCSHDILAVKRDHVARSLLVHSPFVLPDVSSESATTSLKGHTDGYKSCSEAIQRSDDVTVDSTISVKHQTNVPVTVDDQRTDDDCSTSQSHFTQKPMERQQFAGKQIPHRPPPFATRNLSDDVGCRSKSRKHAETFEKELVMTSDQASVKNMRLPKGYAYVPADCLPNEKQTNQDCGPDEPLEHGG